MRRAIRLGLLAACVPVAVVGLSLYRTWAFSSDAGEGANTLMALPDVADPDVTGAAQRLAGAVRIETISYRKGDPEPGKDQAWAELRDYLHGSYPALSKAAEWETFAGNSLAISWQGSNRELGPVVLMGHLDVVPAPSPETWQHAPFSGDIAQGHVWGRGTMDCKGPIIAMLDAAEQLAASGWVPERTIVFQYGHDEEVGGTGAEAGFARMKDQGITPWMVLDEGEEVLTEHPMTGKPAAMIGVSEKGYRSLRITAVTDGGHASIPLQDSGVVRLSKALVALDENQMPINLTAPPLSASLRAISDELPFKVRFAMANPRLFGWLMEDVARDDRLMNAMVRTTTAPTMLEGAVKDNIMPQRPNAVVNFRIHPADSEESLMAHVRKVTGGIAGLEFDVVTEGVVSGPSPVSSDTSRPYRILASIASQAGGGVPVIPAMVVGATDARHAAKVTHENAYRFVPFVHTPADMRGYHGPNEKLSLANLERMIRGYGQILKLAAGPGQKGDEEQTSTSRNTINAK